MNISKLSRNYILCGHFEYHCLLCQETYNLVPDVEKHMRWLKHRDHVKNQPLLPKFRKDFISKIGESYYCILCNVLSKDIEAVKIHASSDQHKQLKNKPDSLTKPVIGKYSYDFIELLNDKISTLVWNGVMGKKCVICNIIVENGAKHIEVKEHVLKLIQSVITEDNGHFYRKINEEIFQCFICKKVFTNTVFSEHKKKHDENNENDAGEGKTENMVSYSKWNDMVDLEGKILVDLHKDLFEINIKNKEAKCKICDSIVFPVRSQLKSHLDIHWGPKDKHGKRIKELEVIIFKDHGKRRSEVAKYGKENYIRLNEGGKLGFCTLCDKYLAPHLGVFIEHVAGLRHTSHLEIKRKEHEKSEYKTVDLKTYVTSISYCKKIEMFRVNTDHLIFDYSFLFLKEINFGASPRKLKCHLCGDFYAASEKYEHCKTEDHKQKFLAARFIENKEEVILREIRPNLYHCGLCNEVLPLSKILHRHLKSFKHVTLRYQTSTNLRPGIDAQQYYYQSLKFKQIPVNLSNDVFYSKVIKTVISK